jgi:hypothetical protein
MERNEQEKKNATYRMRRPLKLRRETLRRLTPAELRGALGGRYLDAELPSTMSDCPMCG